MAIEILKSGEQVRIDGRDARSAAVVHVHVEAPGLDASLRARLAEEVAAVMRAALVSAAPGAPLPTAEPAAVRVAVSLEGGGPRATPQDGALPASVRAEAEARVAAALGEARGRLPTHIAVIPGAMQSLASIDPLPAPTPPATGIVIAFYMKNELGSVEDVFQLLVSDGTSPYPLRGGGPPAPLAFSTDAMPRPPPDPGPGDPGPGQRPPPPPPPPPADMSVWLRLGGNVTWAKRIDAWSITRGLVQQIQVDGQTTPTAHFNLVANPASPYYADTIVFEKPKMFGVWTLMYSLDVSRFWRLFQGKTLVFTWMQD